MRSASALRRAAADRPLSVRMRGDLESAEVAFGGQLSYVVKDPIAGEAFHFSAEEYRLLSALRSAVSLRDLQRIFEAEFAPRQASLGQLEQFVNRLYQQGLVISDNPDQGAELLARGLDRRRRARWAGFVQLLAIRVARFFAAPFVDRLYGVMHWIFSPWALAIGAAAFVYAALAVVGNPSAVTAYLPGIDDLARPGRWLVWIAVIAAVKSLHELGHALVCRHMGARPQELGVMLLFGAPALYCDVTDAWRLPSKWRRMAVSAAGMGVELLIAAVAAIVLTHGSSGLLAAVCACVMVVCSVGTLAVNANPLLRYDGYYLLADALEAPNLAERASGVVSSAWRHWLLGEPRPDDPFVSPRKRRGLWIYAIASKAYLALVLFGILALLIQAARPHRLESAAYLLAAIVLFGMLVRPLTAMMALWTNPSSRARFRWRRAAASLALLAAAAFATASWPVTQRVQAPVAAMPVEAHPLFATTAGELKYAAARGAWVDKGDVVVELVNSDLELALAAQEGQVRERRLRLRNLHTLQATHPFAAGLAPTAAAELADAEARLAEQRTLSASLVIRAPAAGRVLAPPPRPAEPGDVGALQPWNGSPLDPCNRGAWIEAGTPLAIVAAPSAWLAWAAVDQQDAPAVAPGQAVDLLFEMNPNSLVAGRVVQVARRARDNRPGEASHAGGASLSQRLLGDRRYHVVEIALEGAAAPPLLAGARGAAKITTRASTLGAVAWRSLRRAFMRTF